MPRNNRRHPSDGERHQILTGHGCLHPRCPERCSRGRIMCPPHWDAVPWKLRRKLRDANREGAHTQAYTSALTAITDWARRQDVAAQGAGAR